jgi:hypothetical protein
MWNNAKEKILNNSIIKTNINEFTGTPCRIWLGKTHITGYPRISIYGRTMFTHVLSCSTKNKSHKQHTQVTRHLCGNKLCVKEDHLEFGTPSQNAIDNLIHNKSNKKFSELEIKEIRSKYTTKNFTFVDLSKIYKTSPGYVSMIVNNKVWKHI